MGATMAPRDTSKLVDRLLPEGLTAFLAEGRANGDTFADLAYRLRSEHDIDVTQETVRRWCGIYLPTEAAS